MNKTDMLALADALDPEVERLRAAWLESCRNLEVSVEAHGKADEELERLRAALQRITQFTSATPSLSQAGMGRLLAQIEHAATTALGIKE